MEVQPCVKSQLLLDMFTLDTHQAWMTVAKTLSLVGDNICYFAVKNTVCTLLGNNAPVENDEDWILGHVNILEMIRKTR